MTTNQHRLENTLVYLVVGAVIAVATAAVVLAVAIIAVGTYGVGVFVSQLF